MVLVQLLRGCMVRTPGDNLLNMLWLHVDRSGANDTAVWRTSGRLKSDRTSATHPHVQLVQQL